MRIHDGNLPFSVTMTKMVCTYTAPTISTENPTYNGQSKNILATAGSATGGTMSDSCRYYKYDTSTWSDWSGWSTIAPTGTNAGVYNVRYKVEPNAGYSGGVDATEIGNFTINRAAGWCSLSPTGATGYGSSYGGNGVNVNITHHGGVLSASKSGPRAQCINVSFSGNSMVVSKSYDQGHGTTVTVTSAATQNYNAASADFSCNY
ncbi:MAG: hypothetical protein IJP75_02495 [Bacteroidaceae bacterium]|nr:hypothetical protein [Bacteroidaceae bacterium]